MNPTDTLTTLYRHNRWANLRLLERCAGLSDEQLDATCSHFGSIRDTLQHIVTAERSYLSRISTGQPYRHPKDAAPLTLAEMAEWARTSGAGLIEWAPKVQAGDTVQVDWDGAPRAVPTDDPSHSGDQPRHRTPRPSHGDLDATGCRAAGVGWLVVFRRNGTIC